MSMKRDLPRPLVVALALGLPLAARAGAPPPQALPTPFPQARYQQMSARSPFAVSTAAAPVAAATPGFAAQLFVDGVASWAGTEYVGIKSRDPDNPKVLFVAVGTTTPDGLKVERVTWSDVMGKSTVDVSKGGERATLVFDESQIASAGNQGQPQGLIRQPMNFGRPNFPVPSGQPQYGPRFYPQLPGQGQPQLPAGAINIPIRRTRGPIPSVR